MSRYSLTEAALRAILRRHAGYAGVRTFVESGTYLGATTMEARRVFPVVHTIEISRDLFNRAAIRFAGTPGVTFHWGDARDVVRQLAAQLAEPVCWFLDAHWFRGTREPIGGRERGLPLWDELAAVGARAPGDIVVLDDVHVFGRREPSPEWEGVTLETIAARLPGHREAVILGPHAVVYR